MKNKIPTLQPETFKKLLMADIDPFELKHPYFNEFYIRDLSKVRYKLKLPLPPHRKTVNDFIIITSGTMTKSSGIDTYEVRKNSIFALPVGQITSTHAISKNLKGFYCHFSDNFLADNSSFLTGLAPFPFAEWLNNPVLMLHRETVAILMNLLVRIEHIYSDQPNFELIRAYLITFLVELKSVKRESNQSIVNATQRIAFNFKQLLSAHIKAHHEVEFYAGKLAVSPNHLNRCCNDVFEKSTTQLIAETLLLEAKVLLGQPSVSISEVSYSIGFNDPSYFGRFFKKQTGQTPTTFRKILELSGLLPG